MRIAKVSHAVAARLAIPTEEPANEETDVHERAHERRGGERERACRPQKLVQRDAGERPLQIDGPHVMNRHAGKKVVNPQWQPFDSCVEICGIEHPSPCRQVDFEFVPGNPEVIKWPVGLVPTNALVFINGPLLQSRLPEIIFGLVASRCRLTGQVNLVF